MYEQLRVTRNGGEAHINLGFSDVDSEPIRFLAFLLAHHPRVEQFDFARHLPLGVGISLVVRMKKSTSRTAKPAEATNFPDPKTLRPTPWRFAGFFGTEPLIALAMGLTLRSLWGNFINQSVGDDDELDTLAAKAQTLLGQKMPGWQILNRQRFKNRSDLRNTKKVLEQLTEFLESARKEDIKSFDCIYLVHDGFSFPGNRQPTDGILIINTSQKFDPARVLLNETTDK